MRLTSPMASSSPMRARRPSTPRKALGVALRSSIVRVDHLCCGMEAKLIHDILDVVDAVADVKISLSDRRVSVEHTPELSPDAIVDMLNAKFLGASLQEQAAVERVGSSFNAKELTRLAINALQLLIFATLCAMQLLERHRTAEMLGYACVALSFALFHEAYLAIRRRSANVELMMAIAMLGALAQGEPIEAANVGSLVTLMDLVKVFALESVERKLRGSVVAAPLTVDVPGGKKPLAELGVGDVYVLRVGDVVPADGTVVNGSAALDESRLTGEAIPQDKRTGDRVLSGSVVSTGFLQVRTEMPVDASFHSRMADAVSEAKSTLSDMEATVGRFAAWYTPTVLLLAALVGVYKGVDQFLVVIVAGCPCALLGAAPFVQGATLSLLAARHRLLIKRTTALESLARVQAVGLDKTGTLTTGQFELLRMEPVGSYPMATVHEWAAAVEEKDNHPLARSIVSSFKGCIGDFVAAGGALPDANEFRRHGRDGVSAVVDGHAVGVGNYAFMLSQCAQGREATGEATPPAIAVARATEALRASQAEVARSLEEGMPARMLKSLQKREAAARSALDEANERARAAQQAAQQGGKSPSEEGLPRALALNDEWEGSGSVLFVTVDATVAAVLLMADSLKPEAVGTVAALKRLGVRPVMLTGDQMISAQRVASAVAIPECDTHARLKPEDKLRLLLDLTHEDTSSSAGAPSRGAARATKAKGDLEASFLPKLERGPRIVGFVGDGLNDCPALAAAHVGVVLQEVGSQVTIDAASAMLQNDLGELPAAIVIARRAIRLVYVNLFLALAMNLAVIALAATVGLPLWVSVLADNGGLLVVLANSLWPLTWRVRPVVGGD